jgi:hypothetical protein
MVLKHRHLLNVFYHIPDGEVWFGLTRSLNRNLNLSLNRHVDLLAKHGLRGNCHWHGDGPRVLLGNEFLAVVNEMMFLGILRVKGVWCKLRRSLGHLAFLFKLVVQVVDGGVTWGKRTLIIRGGRGQRRVVVVVVDDGILGRNVFGDVVWWSRWCRYNRHGRHGKHGAGHNPGSELRKSNPLLGDRFEDSSQNVVQFFRQRENGLQEVLGSGIGTVSRVLEGSLFPWVASTGEVDEDDSKAPDIIGGAKVVGLPSRGVQAFWRWGKEKMLVVCPWQAYP